MVGHGCPKYRWFALKRFCIWGRALHCARALRQLLLALKERAFLTNLAATVSAHILLIWLALTPAVCHAENSTPIQLRVRIA